MSSPIGKLLGPFRSWWQHKGSLSISLWVTALALVIYFSTFVGERPTPVFDFIHRTELAALDLRFQVRGRGQPDPRIVIVDIDQRSQELLGRWPFPRSHFARMLEVLREDGARVAAFDITFSKPDESRRPLLELKARLDEHGKHGAPLAPRLARELARLEEEFDHDRQFAEAIRRFGKVVLGNFFLYTEADLRGVDASALDRYADLLAQFPFPQARASPSACGPESYKNLVRLFDDLYLVPRGAEANLEILNDTLRGEFAATGFFNVFTDPDGVIRRALLVLPYSRSGDPAEADLYASLDVQAVRLFLELRNDQTILNFGEMGVESMEFGPGRVVKPDFVGRMMINYQGPARTYAYFSLADVVNRNFPSGTFRDKLVLVGPSATGIGDLHKTPYRSLDYPGVEIHANVIDNILNRKFLARGAAQVLTDLGLIALFGIPLGAWLALVQPRWMALGLVLLLPLAGLLHFAFTRGWWLNAVIPVFTLVANTGLVALFRVLVEEREKRRVRSAFQQYLSPEVIRRLLASPELVQPRKTEISVMFSDIRGFTSISEKLDAQELALFLNAYLTDMTRIVFRNRGTLDKYIGDGVMAFWGAPFEESGHAEKACRTALEMMDRLGELRKQWEAQRKPKLEIGLGINTGVASVGNMGSDLRYGYTAMGDAVNLAARLEGLNKEYGTHIIVSETTYQEARHPDFLYRELDLMRVQGKLQPVTIYELLAWRNAAGELEELAGQFAQARANYHRRQWREAQRAFQKILERWPADGPSRTYWKRCQEYLFEEPLPNWDGVFVMSHK